MRSLLAVTLVVLIVFDGVNAGGGHHPKQEQTAAHLQQHPNQPHSPTPPHHGTIHAAASGSGHQQNHQKHQNKVEKAIKEVMESKEANVKELKYENYDHFHAQFVEELKKKLEHMYGNHGQKKEIVDDVNHMQPNRFVNLYIEFLLYETVHEIVAKNEYNELLKIDHKKGEGKPQDSKKSGHKDKNHEKEDEMHVGEMIGEIALEKYKKGMTDADFKKTVEQFHLFVTKLEKKSHKFAGEVKKITVGYEKFKKYYPKVAASTSAHQTGNAPSSPHSPATPKNPKRPVLRVETDRMDLDYHRRKFQEEIEARGLNKGYDTEFYRKHILEHGSDTSHWPVPAHGHEDGEGSAHSPQQHGEGLDLNLPPLRLPSVRVSPRTMQRLETAITQQHHEGFDPSSPPRMYAGLGSQLRFLPEQGSDSSSPPRMYAGLGSQLRFLPEQGSDSSSPPRMYAGLGSQLRFLPEQGSDSSSPPRMYAGLGSQLRFLPEQGSHSNSPPRMYAGLGSQLRFLPEQGSDSSSPPRMYAGLGSQLRFLPEQGSHSNSPPRMYAGLGSQLRFSPESLEGLKTAETIPFEEASPNTLRSLGLHHLIPDDDAEQSPSASDAAEASSPHQSESDFGDERQPSEVSRGSNDAVVGTPTAQRPTGEFSEDELRAVPRGEAEEASDFGGEFSYTERNIVPRGEAEEVSDLENAPKPDDESLSGGSDSVKGVEPRNLNDSFDAVADEDEPAGASNKDDGEETEKPESDTAVERAAAENVKESEDGNGDEDAVPKGAKKAKETGGSE